MNQPTHFLALTQEENMDHPVLQRLHLAAGANVVEEQGRSLITHYGHPKRELHALKQGAGLMDRSACRRIEAHGKDRVRYLNSMLSNEVASLTPGSGSYGLLLTVQGKVIADLNLYTQADRLLLVFSPEVAEAGMAVLEKFLIADKVSWHDVSREMLQLSLQGPMARTIVQRAFPTAEVPELAHQHTQIALGDGQALLIHADRLGLGGFELMVPALQYEPVWYALTAAGAVPVGSTAFEMLRVERGKPLVGKDIGANTIPQEAGKDFEDRAISYKKGCYIGQEVVCRVKSRGQVNWMLTAFQLPPEVTVGTRLFAQSKDVGWVTSRVESPELGVIGLGYVHRNARTIGQHLAAGVPDSPLQVEMRELPPSTP